jgi:hypothetical protein
MALPLAFLDNTAAAIFSFTLLPLPEFVVVVRPVRVVRFKRIPCNNLMGALILKGCF